MEELPDILDFHFPQNNILVALADDLDARFRQLVKWIAFQSYWYYVLNNPQVPDDEFDFVVRYVQELKREIPDEITSTEDPTWLYWGRSPCHYPEIVQRCFAGMPINPRPFPFTEALQGSTERRNAKPVKIKLR